MVNGVGHGFRRLGYQGPLAAPGKGRGFLKAARVLPLERDPDPKAGRGGSSRRVPVSTAPTPGMRPSSR